MHNHKRKYFHLLILLALIFTAGSCRTAGTIARGSSFGHCRGLCNKELTVMPKQLVFEQWANGEGKGKIKVVRVVDRDIYKKLVSIIDWNSFNETDQIIGCPDCADGGAEWIEVKFGKKKRKVTYEYGHAPGKLKDLVEQLKKIQETVSN